MIIEIQCAPPVSPYLSSFSTNQSVGVSKVFTCIANWKWTDNTSGSSTKNGICTLNDDSLSASWIFPGGIFCEGIEFEHNFTKIHISSTLSKVYLCYLRGFSFKSIVDMEWNHYFVEVKCAVPSAPYNSTNTTTPQSVSTVINDYICISNHKWSDNSVRSDSKVANCTLDPNGISAAWKESASRICNGMIVLLNWEKLKFEREKFLAAPYCKYLKSVNLTEFSKHN